jgi:hypothetical protein
VGDHLGILGAVVFLLGHGKGSLEAVGLNSQFNPEGDDVNVAFARRLELYRPREGLKDMRSEKLHIWATGDTKSTQVREGRVRKDRQKAGKKTSG